MATRIGFRCPNARRLLLDHPMTTLSDHLGDAQHALAQVLAADADAALLTDDELLAALPAVESLVRQAEVMVAQLAFEVAHRSRRELGHSGLASRQGFVNPESLVRSLTRSGLREASRSIRVGTMLGESAAAGDEGTPFDEIGAAVRAGQIGVEAADGVYRALVQVVDEIDPEVLRAATATLAHEGVTANADDLTRMARGLRDTLDRRGVVDRASFLRAQRSLRRGRVVDGLRRVSLVLDPESDAIIMGAIDAAMSPRLGGPRFTDEDDRRRAAGLVTDDRSNEQMALDALAELVRIGVDRDDGTILGSIKPGLRVTISFADLTRAIDERGHEHPESDTGVAWLEGCSEPMPASTARRILCDQGALPIVLGGAGEALDLGRTRRLFTRAQRVALAVKFGGCMSGGCDRPASWCEAHHIDPYDQGGATDLGNGILLCRRHHMLLHDHGWRIDREGEGYVLIPPASVDPARTPRPMPNKLPPWMRAG